MSVAPEQLATFDTEYAVHFAELTALARAIGAGHAAEDIVQESLIYARGHLGQLRDTAKLRAWLRRIVVRGVGHARGARRWGSADEAVFVPVDQDLGLDASAAVAQLPTRERLAVVLVHGLGYPQDEAAAMLGVSRGTVASSLWKARRRLARALADYGEGTS
jgi:RNA polymerase sigma-70 factor (ECF subfamily)